MSDEHLNFPKGRISLGAGDLQDAYDINLSAEDGRKLVSTLRRNPAGSTEGERAVTLTFKSAISEAGFERDFWKKWQKKETVQIRVKVPGLTFTVEGCFTKPSITSSVANFIDFSISVIGALTFN